VATNGDGLQFSDADGTYNFNHKIDLSGAVGTTGGEGINIESGSDGTFNFSNVAITSIVGTGFRLDGGTADVNFTGKIIQAVNPAAALAIGGGHAAGTLAGQGTGAVTFNEKTSGAGIVQASTGTGVQFNNADGTYDLNNTIDLSGTAVVGIVLNGADGKHGTIRFNGTTNVNSGANNAVTISGTDVDATTRFAKLNIDTTTGNGLTASSGILEVTDATSTINKTSASAAGSTALNLSNVNVGSGGIKFQEVSVNGSGTATNGIVLNNLTGAGALTINGGTVTQTAGDGISITNVANVSLNNMLITNAGARGINLAHSASNTNQFNVTIANCTVNTTTGEGIYLAADGSGAMHLTLNNNNITQSTANQQAVEMEVGLGVGSNANNTYIVMNGNTFSSTAAEGVDQQAMLLEVARGTCYLQSHNGSFSSLDATQLGATGQFGASFDAQVTGGTLNATVHENTFNSDATVSTTARGFRTAAVGGSVKLSLLDNVGSADSGSVPFLLYKDGGSSFGVELLQTPPATAITDKTPEVNIRNGGSGAYSDYGPPNVTPQAAGWVIQFLPDGAPLTPPMTLGFGNLAAGTVPTQ